MQFRCVLLRIKKASGIFRELITARTSRRTNKKAMLSQGNRAMPQLFFSV